MQKLAMRMLHLNYLQHPSLCRFFVTRCYSRFWGSGLLIHLILLILLSSPSNHILEACRSQAHVDHISKLCGLGSMSAKTAMIFSTQICFRLFPFGGSKTRTYPYKPKRSRVILQPHVKSNTTEQTRSWQILIVTSARHFCF